MKKLKWLFMIGAIGYNWIELLARGRSHWSMSIAGGVSMVLLYLSNAILKGRSLWKKCLSGCMAITVIELLTGLLVNKYLKWNVWDYSERKFNLGGQICLLFSILWFFLCIPIMLVFNRLDRNTIIITMNKKSAYLA